MHAGDTYSPRSESPSYGHSKGRFGGFPGFGYPWNNISPQDGNYPYFQGTGKPGIRVEIQDGRKIRCKDLSLIPVENQQDPVYAPFSECTDSLATSIALAVAAATETEAPLASVPLTTTQEVESSTVAILVTLAPPEISTTSLVITSTSVSLLPISGLVVTTEPPSSNTTVLKTATASTTVTYSPAFVPSLTTLSPSSISTETAATSTTFPAAASTLPAATSGSATSLVPEATSSSETQLVSSASKPTATSTSFAATASSQAEAPNLPSTSIDATAGLTTTLDPLTSTSTSQTQEPTTISPIFSIGSPGLEFASVKGLSTGEKAAIGTSITVFSLFALVGTILYFWARRRDKRRARDRIRAENSYFTTPIGSDYNGRRGGGGQNAGRLVEMSGAAAGASFSGSRSGDGNGSDRTSDGTGLLGGVDRGPRQRELGPNGYPQDVKMENGTYLDDATSGYTPRVSANPNPNPTPTPNVNSQQQGNGNMVLQNRRHQSIYLDGYGNGGNRGRDSLIIEKVMSPYSRDMPLKTENGGPSGPTNSNNDGGSNNDWRSEGSGLGGGIIPIPPRAAARLMGGGAAPRYRTPQGIKIGLDTTNINRGRHITISPISAISRMSNTLRSPVSPISILSTYISPVDFGSRSSTTLYSPTPSSHVVPSRGSMHSPSRSPSRESSRYPSTVSSQPAARHSNRSSHYLTSPSPPELHQPPYYPGNPVTKFSFSPYPNTTVAGNVASATNLNNATSFNATAPLLSPALTSTPNTWATARPKSPGNSGGVKSPRYSSSNSRNKRWKKGRSSTITTSSNYSDSNSEIKSFSLADKVEAEYGKRALGVGKEVNYGFLGVEDPRATLGGSPLSPEAQDTLSLTREYKEERVRRRREEEEEWGPGIVRFG